MFYQLDRFVTKLKNFLVRNLMLFRKLSRPEFKSSKHEESPKHSPSVPKNLTVEVRKILDDYGAVLRTASHVPCLSVVDARNLPHSKQVIIQALIVAISSTSDIQKRDQLKHGLLYLADWQDNVGSNPVGMEIYKNVDLNANTEDLVNRYGTERKAWERWEKIVTAERAAVEQELRELGLW